MVCVYTRWFVCGVCMGVCMGVCVVCVLFECRMCVWVMCECGVCVCVWVFGFGVCVWVCGVFMVCLCVGVWCVILGVCLAREMSVCVVCVC